VHAIFTCFEDLYLDQVFLDFFLKRNIFDLSMVLSLIFEVLCLDQVFWNFFQCMIISLFTVWIKFYWNFRIMLFSNCFEA